MNTESLQIMKYSYGRVPHAILACALMACANAKVNRATNDPPIPYIAPEDLISEGTNHALAAIIGTVVDSATGAPLDSARVVVLSEDNAELRTALTDPRGVFVLGQLKPARYKLVTQKARYWPYMEWRTARPRVVDTVRARMPLHIR